MSVNNILVAFNDSESSEKALDAALAFQQNFDTHMTGLSSQGPSRLSGQVKGWLPSGVADALRQAEQQLYDDVAAKWQAMTQDRGLPGKTHWMQLQGQADTTVIEQARMFDLIFVGQYDTSASDSHMVLNPDKIALQSGRPVQIIPKKFNRGPINNHLVLAWDGKRAAARALADALHLLGNTQKITVVTVGDKTASHPDMPALLTHLERHGVDAAHKALTPQKRGHRGIARAIIDFCEDIRPDSLIMGAYEHSKFREDSVGGVTETIFREATVPVFMSH